MAVFAVPLAGLSRRFRRGFVVWKRNENVAKNDDEKG
jgi:hypothetical protein